jgi:hypothetical protein
MPLNETIADANRKAVALLQNGKYDQAVAAFGGALTGVKQNITNGADQAERAEINDCRDPHTQPLVPVKHQGPEEETRIITSIAIGDCESAEGQTASPGNLLSLYNHAFVFLNTKLLPSAETVTSQQEIDSVSMLSAVLLFNTALTFHVKGLSDGNSRSKNLRQALRLYSMVTICLLSPQDGFGNMFVIQLASWNNMGHIYSHFCEEEKAIQCRARLYRALFEDSAGSLCLRGGYPYAVFYIFTVCSEVRRRRFKYASAA